jgi:hypothetical protein
VHSTDIGDEVWVLGGAATPYVLRPIGGGRYRLVGDAYVHGIMHGEVSLMTSWEISDVIIVYSCFARRLGVLCRRHTGGHPPAYWLP